MRVRHIQSSTVVVESGDTRVLCDPWLLDGAFYGAWAHYPPLEFEPEDFDDVDYIYVSHIHPDHCHAETLERLDSDIPVLIHDYEWDFLRRNIEAAGFDVHEIPHNERVSLGDDLEMNVLASDNCDPEVCGNHFACSWLAEAASTNGGTGGSTQIDSMAVFDDGEHTVVNLNDCRWPMTQHAAMEVSRQYDEIDLLMLQYTFAGSYPQSRLDYSHEELLEAREERRIQSLENAVGFIELFEPRYYMPFAGEYTLSGHLASLNEYVARSTRSQAKAYFEDHDRIDSSVSECLLLNSGESVEVATGEQSAPYTPIDQEARATYAEEVLEGVRFGYEEEPMPDLEAFEDVFPDAYEHFDEKRRAIGFESETEVYLSLVDGTYARFTADGEGYEYVDGLPERNGRQRVRMEMDPRLTLQILKGPRYAHFNNAYIGSHLQFAIEPDVFERALFYSMSFLHA
ncbi:MBL fold metallo-hydrolase [Natronobiforma cellulositropha]|uniref:MBL fold metallo-hydrolase n=1 Tax=Natronobiforma cellulositropha TaxID=1679076 RepID=UPI0021D5C2E9|nr:MBL fold metallo-hydrolase [Natronobiforma cellulositropha]